MEERGQILEENHPQNLLDGSLKYYSGESEVIVRLRELFPACKIFSRAGVVSVCHDKTWFSWHYESWAPEQQLDTLTEYVEKHFQIKRLKCRNEAKDTG